MISPLSSPLSAVLWALFVVVSYFIGNISPATLVGRACGVDIRKEGSGNPGTTNVLRTLGKKAAAVTLLVDILKGAVPVLVGSAVLGETGGTACGTAAFLGHIWPVTQKFRGGKGIATGFGVLLGFDWRIGLSCLACAALFMVLTRRVSCGSIAAAISLPIFMVVFDGGYLPWSIAVALIVLWRHRTNIVRLVRGEEPPVSLSKKKEEQKREGEE